jgi:phage terminase large subunit GpA-like protein
MLHSVDIKNFVDQSWAIGYAPDPLLTIDEWADQYRVLSQKGSSEPGQWRTDRTPYLREIMQDLSPSSPVERVVFMAGAQVGKSETGNNFIGYIIDQAPGPIMMVQPTVQMVQDYSKQLIAPMIEESPRLRGKVRDPRKRDSGNTIQTKEFTGGFLAMTGANSAAALRSKPIRFLYLDEVDSYPGDVDGEGDPIKLAEKRTATFARRKIFICSTPKIDGTSRIQREFEASDQRYCFLPCPHCREMQKLEFGRLRWPKDQPRLAKYICCACEKEIGEEHKTAMLAAHEWRAQNPGAATRGYHLSSLYSPVGWYGWAEAAADFIAAQKDDALLKQFVNTVLGETWKQKGEAPDWERLYARRGTHPAGQVPEQCLIITAGVDVQKDRIELEFVAWAADRQSWSLDYVVLDGDTSRPEVWKKLSDQLYREFVSAHGEVFTVRRMAIDSGYATQEVYAWARNHPADRVMVIKGHNGAMAVGAPSAADITFSGRKIKMGLKIWPVAGGILKSELYGQLRLGLDESGEPPPGYCHFPNYAPDYFKQLTAEVLRPRTVRGIPRLEWEKPLGVRNEVLDCQVYARAAAIALGLDRVKPQSQTPAENKMQVNPPASPALVVKNRQSPNREKSWIGDHKGWLK